MRSIRTHYAQRCRVLHELFPVLLRKNVRKVHKIFKSFDHSLAAPSNLTFFGCGGSWPINRIKKMESFAFGASAAEEDAEDLQNEGVQLGILITLLHNMHHHIVVGHA